MSSCDASAPSAAARFRAHPQLRIPRQPEPRYSVAAVLATTRQITTRHSYAGIPVHRSGSFTMELSSLQWNHARRRTALCRATHASVTATTRPARSMKLCLNPRSLPAFRSVCGSLVPSGADCSVDCSFGPRLTPRCGVSPIHRNVKAAHPTRLRRYLIPLHPLRPIQST
jgi:hypothetical protein